MPRIICLFWRNSILFHKFAADCFLRVDHIKHKAPGPQRLGVLCSVDYPAFSTGLEAIGGRQLMITSRLGWSHPCRSSFSQWR
jgi:hypothetical protein